MLVEKDAAKVEAFREHKRAQWDRIAGSMPGLQFVASGERGTQFMIVCSTPDFYEGVVIGQLAHLVMETYGSPAQPRRRAIPNAKKPLDRRGIDLTDEQVDAVLDRWRLGRSAIDLPFVAAIYDLSGLARTK